MEPSFVLVAQQNKPGATPAGFEPARAEPNGLAGHRLNQLGQSVFVFSLGAWGHKTGGYDRIRTGDRRICNPTLYR